MIRNGALKTFDAARRRFLGRMQKNFLNLLTHVAAGIFRAYGVQGRPVNMQTVPAPPERQRSSVSTAFAQFP